MQLKRILAAGAVLLCVAGCSRVPAGPSSVTAPAENVSTPASESAPAPKDVSNHYVEDASDGISDQEAVNALCIYLWGNLRPKDYCYIGVESGGKDPSTGERIWAVEVYAPDKAPFDTLLQDYDGPWAPVHFNQSPRTFLDLAQAQTDMQVFLEQHPEIEVTLFSLAQNDQVIFLEVAEMTDELTAFVENYPVKDIFKIHKPPFDVNPD